MALLDDLVSQVSYIIHEDKWDVRNGQVVPDPQNIGLGNKAVYLENATVLYADLDGSTMLVDNYGWNFAAEIYKTFLYCATKLIKAEGGAITSYDGDRVMGIFVGDTPCSNAAKCAMKINYAVRDIINPSLQKQYNKNYVVKQVVGIDQSEIRAARTGVRGDNDIVWVGSAANYAAKLTTLNTQPTWITERVYNKLTNEMKENGEPKRSMWTKHTWTPMNNMVIYASDWWWKP